MNPALKKTALALALAAAHFYGEAHASEQDLLARIDRLAAELQSLKAELKTMKSERAAAPAVAAPSSTAPVVAALAPPAAMATASASSFPMPGLILGQTSLFGYGEINYNHPTHDSSQTKADLRRAVVGIGHRFDDKTEMGMEIEFEHAVTSSTDRGEAEIEQMWLDRRINDNLAVRAGLFLIPMGFTNERHEPPTFYGVERNFVETAIIPSTWREGGIMLRGNTDDSAWAWNAGITTGFDLSKWDATSTDGRDSPLGSIHQELQFAKAKDLSLLGALNYRGVLGLTAGGGIFSGKIAQGKPNFPSQSSRLIIWDMHARWTPGAWDLQTVYARGTISDTAPFNQTLIGNPTLVPKEFWGWYGQAAYKLWNKDGYSLAPFVRYERFNTGAQYADLGTGLTPAALPTETVTTVGANFKIHPNVVLKADYQKFRADSGRDRFDLGLGFMY